MPEESSPASPHYRRVILKLSGESLAHAGERGISMDEVSAIAGQIKQAHALGCQIAVVVGGGNILRGAQFKSATTSKVEEATAHYMGMLATVINALALQEGLEAVGCVTRVMSAIRMDGVCEPFIRRRAVRHMEKGRIVVLGAGTGSPFVTTDTAATQRALELGADIVLKATRVMEFTVTTPRRIRMQFCIANWTTKRSCRRIASDGWYRDLAVSRAWHANLGLQLQERWQHCQSHFGAARGDSYWPEADHDDRVGNVRGEV